MDIVSNTPLLRSEARRVRPAAENDLGQVVSKSFRDLNRGLKELIDFNIVCFLVSLTSDDETLTKAYSLDRQEIALGPQCFRPVSS